MANLDELINKTLAKHKEPLSIDELSHKLNRPKRHVSRKLNIMEKYGYVHNLNPNTKGRGNKSYWILENRK